MIRKSNVIAVFASLLLVLGAAGCANDSSDPTADTYSGSGSGNSNSNTAVEAGITTKQKASTNAQYTKKVSIDLSDTPLSDTTVSNLKEGDDVTEWFVQNTVKDNSSASSRAVLSDEAGLSNFTVKLVKITATEIIVSFEAKTPSYDCEVYVSVVIPAECTKEAVVVTKTVQKIEVGVGVDESDDSAADMTIPNANEMKGKVFLTAIDDGKEEDYIVFSSDGSKISGIDYHNGVPGDEQYWDKYEYSENDGSLTEIYQEYKEGEMVEARRIKYYVTKINENYYLTDADFKLEKTSSDEGIYATFKYEHSKEEKENEYESKRTGSSILIFNEDHTFSGTGLSTYYSKNISYQYSYNEETSKYEKNLDSYTIYEKNRNETGEMSGIFANAGGILTLKGKNIWHEEEISTTTESGKAPVVETGKYTHIYDYENELFIYDGTDLLIAHPESKLPISGSAN